jgi:hypothetical protein
MFGACLAALNIARGDIKIQILSFFLSFLSFSCYRRLAEQKRSLFMCLLVRDVRSATLNFRSTRLFCVPLVFAPYFVLRYERGQYRTGMDTSADMTEWLKIEEVLQPCVELTSLREASLHLVDTWLLTL